MAKLTNKQKDTLRKNALQDLLNVKDKIKSQTYNAYKTRINNKRIDAVKRIGDELKLLNLVNQPTKIAIKKIKEVVTKIPSTVSKLQSLVRKTTQKHTIAKKQVSKFSIYRNCFS